MRYLIVGNVALLAHRNIKTLKKDTISLEVVGISPIAKAVTVSIMRDGEPTRHYTLENNKVKIPRSELYGEGNYSVTFTWKEEDPNTGEEIPHSAYGNSFQICSIGNTQGLAPAYTHTTTDIDMMWSGVVQLLDELLPFIEQYKYGNDAV